MIIDGVQSGKEQIMIIRVNYMKSMYPMEIEADSVEEALNTYWYEVEWDESYDIIEDDEKKKPCGLDYCPQEEIIGIYASCTACAWG